MRGLTVFDCGTESSIDAFSRDHVAICRVARDDETAILLVRRAMSEAVSLGRFHRRPGAGTGLVRRLSGGRAIAVGPGIVSVTGVYPSTAWLAFGGTIPGPEQVLNRVLRPLLGALRALGVDAFYGGRDLVTWDRSPIAVASFTVLPDGVVVAEAHVATATSLARCTELLGESDPRGVVLHDASVFTEAPALDRRVAGADAIDWAAAIAEHAAVSYACEVRTGGAAESLAQEPIVERAFDALQTERGEVAADWSSALAIEMLGAVEVAARIEDGRIAELELSGDLIASYGSVAEIQDAFAGQPVSRAAAERTLLTVLSRPGRFVLGARDLAALIARLA